jgi:hypothetical protein
VKKLLLIAVLLVSGCLPNTRRGWSQDTINRETETIQAMDQQIYAENKLLLPEKTHQVGESMGWQERMQNRMRTMREGS